MEEFQEVVFAEDITVATGAHAVRFEAGVPRKVAPRIAAVAVDSGAQISIPVEKDVGLRAELATPKKPRKKRAPKRDA